MPNTFKKKPRITMNRKRYGTKAKPVRQQKPEIKLEKPSNVELRSIYSGLKKSASWQIPNVLAEAVQWYRRMTAFLYASIENHNPRTKALLRQRWSSLSSIQTQLEKSLKIANVQISSIDKQVALVRVITLYEQIVEKLGGKVTPLKNYLKKAKASAKKLDDRKAKTERRFDPLLTMLSAAFDIGIEIGAVPALSGVERFNYDPTLDRMLYSRDALVKMKKRIRAEGLLPVFLEELFFVARCASMRKSAARGLYLPDNAEWLNAIALGMKNLCKWLATSQEAPARLVKRTVPKKKRTKKMTRQEAQVSTFKKIYSEGEKQDFTNKELEALL